jgi:UDP:flavonoid glycosyltransferase YjiC (YdhE family)
MVADQFFWGARVRSLGAGPAPVPFTKLSSERLAAVIRQAVINPTIRARAAALGYRIRSEDGVGRAVEALGQMLGFGLSLNKKPQKVPV